MIPQLMRHQTPIFAALCVVCRVMFVVSCILETLFLGFAPVYVMWEGTLRICVERLVNQRKFSHIERYEIYFLVVNMFLEWW